MFSTQFSRFTNFEKCIRLSKKYRILSNLTIGLLFSHWGDITEKVSEAQFIRGDSQLRRLVTDSSVLGDGKGFGCLVLVEALALILESQGLGDGHVSISNAYLGVVQFELKGNDEAVGSADDQPA